jgi:hypothetical protein
MKNIFAAGFVVFTLVFCFVPLFGQGRSIGIDLGTTPIHWENWVSDDYDYIYVGQGDVYVPKQINLSFSMKIGRGLVLRGFAGYGFAVSNNTFDQPRTQFDDNRGDAVDILKYEEKSSVLVHGFSVGATLVVPIVLNDAATWSVYPGIGVGYCRYGFSGDWSVIDENYNSEATEEFRYSGEFAHATLDGFAQYFVLGIEKKITDRIALFLESSKIGLSLMHETVDSDYTVYDESGTTVTEAFRKTISTQKTSYTPQPGLSDVSISFGVRIGI